MALFRVRRKLQALVYDIEEGAGKRCSESEFVTHCVTHSVVVGGGGGVSARARSCVCVCWGGGGGRGIQLLSAFLVVFCIYLYITEPHILSFLSFNSFTSFSSILSFCLQDVHNSHSSIKTKIANERRKFRLVKNNVSEPQHTIITVISIAPYLTHKGAGGGGGGSPRLTRSTEMYTLKPHKQS